VQAVVVESESRRRAAGQGVQPGKLAEGQKGKMAGKKVAVAEGPAGEQHPLGANLLAVAEGSGNRKKHPLAEWTAVRHPERKGKAERPPGQADDAAATDGDPGIGPPPESLPRPAGRALPSPRHSTSHRAAGCHVPPCEQRDLPEGSLHNGCNRGVARLIQSWSIHVVTWSLFLNEGKGIQPVRGYSLSIQYPFPANARKSDAPPAEGGEVQGAPTSSMATIVALKKPGKRRTG
jgi:hypothetical protein